ncbi:MAG: SRPBCC domain-containing protein [bacterium]|nr:SRPBCC domain-containing protein [bacterium]
MKIIKQSYSIKASIERVWKALVDPGEIEGWGAAPAKMDDGVGTQFSLWGGDIYGKNIEVEAPTKLKQEWYGGKWPKPSLVTFTLTREKARTRLDLIHEDVPDKEASEFDDGWKRYYCGSIKEYLEG